LKLLILRKLADFLIFARNLAVFSGLTHGHLRQAVRAFAGSGGESALPLGERALEMLRLEILLGFVFYDLAGILIICCCD